MGIASGVMDWIVSEIDPGYEGPSIDHEGQAMKFVGYRTTYPHGLLGLVPYRRASYHHGGEGGYGYVPLDERLGIERRNTPCCRYFLSSCTDGRRTARAWHDFTGSSIFSCYRVKFSAFEGRVISVTRRRDGKRPKAAAGKTAPVTGCGFT